MLTVSLKQLVEAIGEANEFRLPDMNMGTEYLYDRLYRRLSRGEDVRLSELDFNAFGADDITSLENLHINTFEKAAFTASGITSELRKIAPVYVPAAFV